MEIGCRVYKPRRPRESPLYRLVERHPEELLRVWPERFARRHGPLRAVVERVLREFLRCGLLEHGFARLWCGSCRRSVLVAFSCRGRSFCPSCEKKKQLLWADWLRDEVLAEVAHRHVVLTIPASPSRAPNAARRLPDRIAYRLSLSFAYRFFTIILLGESVAAAIHGLDHAPTLHATSLVVALAASLVAFLFWTGYFERGQGVAERRVVHADAGRRLRLWAYAHVPLYLGVAGLAAGTVALAGHPDAHGPAPWLFASAAALAMLGVTTVAASGAVELVWASPPR